MRGSIRTLLRSRSLVAFELAGLVGLGALSTLSPEPGGFIAAGFAIILSLAAASLSVVTFAAWGELPRRWRTAPELSSFDHAAFVHEVERPARPGGAGPRVEIATRGKIALAAAPILHSGLLMMVFAGLGTALFGRGAAVEMLEGEALAGYGVESGGLLSKPLAVPPSLVLEQVEARRHASGELADLALVTRTAEGERSSIAPNAPLDVGAERFYSTHRVGPAALLSVRQGGREHKSALLMSLADGMTWEAPPAAIGSLEVRARSHTGDRASEIELRVLRGGGLLAMERLRPGEAIRLVTGEEIALVDVRMWAELRGSRDPAVGLVYVGFALITLGVFLFVAFIRVDTAVVVTPSGSGERVFVALRAQRHAPIFREDFEALIARELER